MKVSLVNVRLAFPNLFEAKSFGGDEATASHGASFLFPKTHPAYKLVTEAIEAAAADKWEKKAADVLKQLRTADRTALHDGDSKKDYAGFEGNFFVAARNKSRPLVIDKDKSPLTAADGKPYAGCYVNAIIDIWAQDNKFGKRINATLSGVQFAKDGEAFSGSSPASTNDFEDLSSELSDEI